MILPAISIIINVQTKTEQKKEAIMNGIAHSKESEDAWEELLAKEDEHDPVEDDVTIDTIYRLVCKLRDIADGEDTAEAIRKPADTAQLVKAINEDNYRAWEVVAIPFDGHTTHHHISNDNDYMPIDGVIDDIRKTANECASLERNNEADRKTAFRCLDRAERMLSWLEPTAEDYYGVPRIKAVTKLIKAETGLLTDEERDEPGDWRDDFIGQVAIAYK